LLSEIYYTKEEVTPEQLKKREELKKDIKENVLSHYTKDERKAYKKKTNKWLVTQIDSEVEDELLRATKKSKLSIILAECTQYPIKLAYAISIHKSQGQSFDNITVDLTNCWTPGLGYVALSRATSLKGISLLRNATNGKVLNKNAILVTDKSIEIKKDIMRKAKELRKANLDFYKKLFNNEIDFKKYGTFYFPVYDCEGDGALQRKSQEAKDYFEKNFESLQRDYKEYLEKAKKYLFSSNSYIVKNAYQSYIEYDHNLYEKTGRLKVNLDDKFSSFMIKEADNKPFDKLQFYIEPSKKQIDLIDKAQRSKIYRLQVDFKLDSLKDVMRNKGCNNFLREESTCIVTKLVDAKLNIVKVADLEEDDKDMPAYIYEDRHHWELLDSLPIKWE